MKHGRKEEGKTAIYKKRVNENKEYEP